MATYSRINVPARYDEPRTLCYARHILTMSQRYDPKTHAIVSSYKNGALRKYVVFSKRHSESSLIGEFARGLTALVSASSLGNGRILNPARICHRDFEFATNERSMYIRHAHSQNKAARSVMITFGGCAASSILRPTDIGTKRKARYINITPYRTEFDRATAFCALVARSSYIGMQTFKGLLSIRTFSEAINPTEKSHVPSWDDGLPAGTPALHCMTYADFPRSLP